MPLLNNFYMAKVYIGIGSNLGNKGENIQKSLIALERWGVKILMSSKLYETEPVGPIEQPWFLNMAVCGQTALLPEELLKAIHSIELSLGRERREKWGPRTIDLDILFYDDAIIDIPGLTIPHREIANRKFVLIPMDELVPGFMHPVLKKTVGNLLKECPDKAIVRPL
jgi:2-amino-4-hydroxy-6-hydroxymethyldihydropteridine diphosphokinase